MNFLLPSREKLPFALLCAVSVGCGISLECLLPAGDKMLWVQRNRGEAPGNDFYLHEVFLLT